MIYYSTTCLLASHARVSRCNSNKGPWEQKPSSPSFPEKEYPVDSDSWEWLTLPEMDVQDILSQDKAARHFIPGQAVQTVIPN